MRLDMAMQQPGAGVDDLVADGDPGGPLIVGQKVIAVPGFVEVEAAGLFVDGGVDGRPFPLAGIGANDVGLVAVLVHRVRELDRLGRVPADLEDQVHPRAVFRPQREVRVFGVVRFQVPEERLVRAAVHFVRHGRVRRVAPGVAEAAELEVKHLVGVLGDRGRVEGGEDVGVEGDNVGGDVGAGVVDVREGWGLAGGVGVREGCKGRDGLVESGVGDAEGVVAGFVVELDHDAVTLAVPDGKGLHQLRLDVVAVDGVDPHGVLVDGDGEGFYARAADPVDAGPFVFGVHVDGLVTGAAVRGGADVLESRGKELGVAVIEEGSLRVENVGETSSPGFSVTPTSELPEFVAYPFAVTGTLPSAYCTYGVSKLTRKSSPGQYTFPFPFTRMLSEQLDYCQLT